ncbi:MDR family MFS transporter [Kineosporia sp. NBRC 101731]|uniref:MDR family MFS transporter n=1 Tax=Kineosporia sp. NBRC 101731 TaxID=3032199 RepID=UPI0024A1B679|nr:MDR family MFS transporter [Kineosporia sp. NBRC 101731]GLY26956.1 MFS transporter [Kineosporia sp. NBRC 101731]
MSTPTPPEPGAATALTHRQILVIISGLMMGMLLAALDLTIVSTSIRTISDDLDGLSVQAWVTTAYLITSTISTPLYGKLSDLYGRRPFFLTAISLFVVGSAMCGLAQDMYQLAAFRAFQGLGAGGLFSLALAIVGDIVPPRDRAKYQGYFLAVFGSSSVLGPLVGGFFAGTDTILWVSGWRWVFLINVPIGIIALTVVGRVLHIPHTRRDHRIDVPGAVALTVMLVPLLVVAEQGRIWGWTSGRSIACIAVGVIGFFTFVAAERRIGDDALIPIRLLGNRTFTIGSTLNFIIGVGMFGGLAALPLYLQIVKEHSPTESGLLMLPLTAGMMSGSILSGQFISRTGRYKIFPIAGSVLFSLGMFLYSTMNVDTSLVVVGCFALIFGLGLGFNMQTLVLAMQNSVPPRDMGVATSSATFFRQMGGTLGTAVFLSVLFGTVASNIMSKIQAAARDPDSAFSKALQDPAVAGDPANAPIVNLVKNHDSSGINIDDSSFLSRLDHDLARPVLEGFAQSMHLVFAIGAGVMVIAFVISWFLPEEKLRTESGLQARAAAE